MEPERPERGELPQDRLFWVLLTIFGSMFATGSFIVFQNLGWGLFELVSGFLGLVVLVRDRANVNFLRTTKIPKLPGVPLRTLFLVLASATISIFVGHTISQIMTIQTAVTQYVLPRSLTDKQADQLRELLSNHKAYSVTVKANPLDSEAMEYAAQLYNALHGTEWTVELSTSNQDPNTLNQGLCIDEVGENTKPKFDPKDDPVELLRQAFQAANIEVNCSGGAAAGEYKLFLLVGHRPLVMNAQPPVLVACTPISRQL
ncbi:MAG: hypothetical protein WCD12_14350 [Candidatus Binatus sp.]|jgi:hypothetical protein|uniref:hypothetical protein n=1 Tax=Candidatus Binatus sp. TaxID=2811406 RepID=UPI003C76E390